MGRNKKKDNEYSEPEHEQEKSPANAVDSSLCPAHNKTKENINQRNFLNDDRSIDLSAENEQIVNHTAVESVENSPSEFAQILTELGVDWYDIRSAEPKAETDFCELHEGFRKTNKCTIPYYFKNSRRIMTEALKYLTAYSYYTKDGKYPEHSELTRAVIDCIAEMVMPDSVNLAGERVMYYEIIDKVNDVIHESSLPDWLNSFEQRWREITSQTYITHKRKYLKSCIWTWLKDWRLEEYEDIKKFDLLTGSGDG